MRRIWTLVALSAALTVAANRAAAATTPDDGFAAAAARPGAVTALSILPATGKADVVIAVDNSVDVQDFTLAGPERIVLDLSGATLGMPPQFYDKVSRGGITNVRVAQYRKDVVRVVLELDAPHQYEVTRTESEIRISVSGAAASFAAWHAGNKAARASKASAQAAADRAAQAASDRAAQNARDDANMATGETVVADAAPTPSAKVVLKATAPQQSQQPRITVTYQDADIRDVLAAFAAFSGRTIVVGQQVVGTVTAEIRDQPWDVALQAILQASGLAASEDPQTGIITVDSYANILAKRASEPLVTQMVAVNYANANSLVATIASLLSKDCAAATPQGAAAPVQGGPGCVVRGTVSADTATNTLLITEVPSRMADMIAYVNALDVRTPQVAIKAKIIFVNRTDTEQLGVSYDLGSASQFSNQLINRNGSTSGTSISPDQISLGGDVVTGVANARRTFRATSAISLIYSTMIGKFTLSSFIDALQEVRLADVQAEPNIVTLDNRAASILVGEETPIRVVDATSGAGARANVQFKESGIRLDVTPHITNNRQILMNLHAEQSQLQAASADIGFTFLKRRAVTQLLVNDGETATIGGLTLTNVTTSKSGIPFLVDLPLIGRLFGETSTSEQKQDLLILITPHIVDEGEAVRPTNR